MTDGSPFRVFGALIGGVVEAYDIRIGGHLCSTQAPSNADGHFPGFDNIYSTCPLAPSSPSFTWRPQLVDIVACVWTCTPGAWVLSLVPALGAVR